MVYRMSARATQRNLVSPASHKKKKKEAIKKGEPKFKKKLHITFSLLCKGEGGTKMSRHMSGDKRITC